MLDLRDKRVTVFGLGKSGVAVAKRLAEIGARVFVTEELPASRISAEAISELKGLGVEMEFEGHTDRAMRQAQMIVLSPGVHLDLLVLEEARRLSIPIISEIELAYHFLRQPIIAITGTNGKTTTTTLVGEILKEHGCKVAVAGNIGLPLISVRDESIDYIVAEISSYQLEGIINFQPFISVILNITPDHLERHKNLEAYALSKANIFRNQKARDFLIYNLDSPAVRKLIAPSIKATLLPFSRRKKAVPGIFMRKGSMVINLGEEEEEVISKGRLFLKGEHNLENCLAAALAARLCKVPPRTIARVLEEFRGVEHRIEYVARIRGVSFYNDSKGTNPDSTVVALKTLAPPGPAPKRSVVLIAGGKDKGVALLPLVREIQKRAKAVVLIGEAQERFRDELLRAGYQDIFLEGSMASAVERAFHLASESEVVLLSPACASFDMFSNYEERGRVFKEAVSYLERKEHEKK